MLTEQKHHTMRNATMSCLGTMWVLAVLLLCGCSRTSEFRARLMALDSVLVQHPDSVYDVMVKMEAEAHGQSQSDRMYYELLRADAQNKAYVDFTTDSVMAEVADWYDRHGTPNEQMRAHYLLGCTYRDLGDVPMELQCFLDATTKADTASKDCDLYTLAAIYGQMADIYDSQYLPEEELRVLKMCEHISLLDGDSISAIDAKGLYIRPLLMLNKHDCVLNLTKEITQKYINLNLVQRAARLLGPAISILLDREEYDSARTYMTIFENKSGYFDNEGNIEKKASVYLHDKGRYYLHINQIDSAINSFERLLSISNSDVAAQGLMCIYRKLGITDSVVKYSERYAAANDSSLFNQNSEMIEQMTAMYNYGRHKRIAEEKVIENSIVRNENNRLILILSVSILLFITIIMVVRNQYKEKELRKKHEMETIIKRYNSTQTRLNTLQAELVKSEIQYQENQYKTQKISELHENQKQELEAVISKLKSELQSYRDSNKDIEFGVWMDSFQNSSIVYTFIDKARKPGKNHIYVATEKEWNTLEQHFTHNATKFYHIVNSSEYGLGTPCIRVILLIVLGFTTKEISLVFGVSGQYITNIKKRINTVLFQHRTNTNKLNVALIQMLQKTLS